MVTDHPDARLHGLPTCLKLTALCERLDSLLNEAARRELSLRDSLVYLCEAEVAHKEQRRIDMGGRIAHFSFLRSVEDQLAIDAKPKVLIVDERGYRPFAADAAYLLFQLGSRRYGRGSLLVTSNRAAGES